MYGNNKSVLLLALGLAMLLLLSACSDNAGNGDSNGNGNKAGQEKGANNQDASDPGKDGQGGGGQPVAEAPAFNLDGYTLRMSAWWDLVPAGNSRQDEKRRNKIKELEEKYNVKFEFLNIPFEETIPTLASTTLAGEPMADLVYFHVNGLLPHMAREGVIRSLDEYIDFTNPILPGYVRNTTYQGKHYGIYGSDDSARGIWFNKDIIARAGAEDPGELLRKGEWTWDKYLEIAKATTKDLDGDGIIDQFGVTLGFDPTDSFIFSNGGKIIDEVDGQMKFVLDSENAIEALDFVGRLFHQHQVATYENQPAFEQGKAALYGGEPWMISELAEKLGDALGFVPYPRGPRGTDFTSVTTDTGFFAMPSTVPHPQEILQIVMEYFEFDLDPDEAKASALESKRISMESQLSDVDSVDVIINLYEKNVINTVNAFPEVREMFNDIILQTRAGESGAKMVEQYKAAAQAALDRVAGGQ